MKIECKFGYGKKPSEKKLYSSRKERSRKVYAIAAVASVFVAAVVLIAMLVIGGGKGTAPSGKNISMNSPRVSADKGKTLASPRQTESSEPSPSPIPEGTLSPDLKPVADSSTTPAAMGLQTQIMSAGQIVSSYTRSNPVNFPETSAYTQLPGVTTFRGDNYRDGGSYGTANVTQGKLKIAWTPIKTGCIDGGWTGTAWTGQPLIVQWPDSLKKIMDLTSDAKAKEGLKEVLLPCLDGKIYCFDLDTGLPTRLDSNGNPTLTPIKIGAVTKGTATIDPRGYPMLYTGQGVNYVGGKLVPVYYRAFSLIDGSLLWKFPDGVNGKDPFSYRKWQAYDGSPLVDAESDTFVEGGENGILYSAKLNTQFDSTTGKITINPTLVKYRYKRPGYADSEDTPSTKTPWWGVENSVVGWRNYAIFTDNGGTMQCVDLNTLKPVWAQEVTDDSDTTMPLEEDPSHNDFYLYTSNEVDKQPGQKLVNVPITTSNGAGSISYYEGNAYLRKIDGVTGKIIWQYQYTGYDSLGVDGDNGGCLTSPVLGKRCISNLIIYSTTMVPNDEAGKNNPATGWGGQIIALDRTTGKVVWKVETHADYWSSPLVIYGTNGKAYLVQCDRQGYMKLYDASNGALLDTLDLQVTGAGRESIEATPSAFGNMIVVGTRSERIYGIQIY